MTLKSINGTLYVPQADIYAEDVRTWMDGDAILVCVYDAGDCDTISWPLPEAQHARLRRALYDGRETGLLHPLIEAVTLPDGMLFEI
jgi:hypothetical protein